VTHFGQGDRSRILVKATNWLGDVVMGMPALRALRRAAPDAHLAVLIRGELATLLAGAHWIDEVIPYRHPAGIDRVRQVPRIVRTIRAGRFDWAIVFPNRPEAALWMFLARVPNRVGYELHRRGPLLTLKARPSDAVRAGHQVHWYLDLLRQTLGVEGSPVDGGMEVDSGAAEKMRAWLAAARRRPGAPLAALAPAAAYGPAKEWPADRYVELVDRLDAEGWECVIVGAPPERARCEQVRAKSRAGAVLAAGETSVGDLAALLSLCQGFVGNDSGAMHLAAALGLPTVGLFGSTSPERTGPVGPRAQVLYERIECSPCLARTCRFGHMNCFRPMTAERVLETFLRSVG
jgi:lipopolysaccharide heptosyltransferase II